MKVLVVRNPIAGSMWQSLRFHEIENNLKSASIRFQIKTTAGPGDATRFAEEAKKSACSHVLVFGGDGTIRETAQALAGSDVILVPVPTGTANLLAHELGLEQDVQRLVGLLKNGCVKRIDLGCLDGKSAKTGPGKHYFVLMAGIGMDAVAVKGVDPKMKRWLGWVLYIISGFWHVPQHRAFKARLVFTEPSQKPVQINAWVIVIGNARAYGLSGVRVATHAKIDDGLLDICVFQSRSFLHFMTHFFKVLMGKHLEDKSVLYFQTKGLRIETDRAVPVQLDGDIFGETPLEISVVPQALNILLPPDSQPQTRDANS